MTEIFSDRRNPPRSVRWSCSFRVAAAWGMEEAFLEVLAMAPTNPRILERRGGSRRDEKIDGFVS